MDWGNQLSLGSTHRMAGLQSTFIFSFSQSTLASCSPSCGHAVLITAHSVWECHCPTPTVDIVSLHNPANKMSMKWSFIVIELATAHALVRVSILLSACQTFRFHHLGIATSSFTCFPPFFSIDLFILFTLIFRSSWLVLNIFLRYFFYAYLPEHRAFLFIFFWRFLCVEVENYI